MNWNQFRTLLWVRWRISVNHVRRHGKFNLIVLLIAGGLSLILSVIGFFVALIVGTSALPTTPAATLMYIWDAWVAAFLMFWMIGVVTDLQRSEMLSVDKLLHLPTTLKEVYLFNFLSSLLSLTTLCLVPPMLGLSIAMVLAKGPASLLMFPLVAGFVLMVCAVTYQFRGWLATLMANKRRQRTIMAMIGVVVILVSQLPNIVNLNLQRQNRQLAEIRNQELREGREKLRAKLQSGEIQSAEYLKLEVEQQKQFHAAVSAQNQLFLNRMTHVLDTANLVLPIGWIAWGAKAAADDNPWPGLAGVLGMAGITCLSLRRSYTTTMRYFTSDFGTGPQIGAPVSAAAVPILGQAAGATAAAVTTAVSQQKVKSHRNMIEWSMPLVSAPVSAIAWATLRSMTRAPEVKMILIGPFLMMFLYGAMVLPSLGQANMAGVPSSLIPLGVLGFAISGLAALTHNCFGFDRSGFRAYVLSGVPRRDILLGKNLALVPLVLVLTVPTLFILQCLSPAPWGHFLATLLIMPTSYLTLSVLGNFSSIYCPMGYAAGTMKPATYKTMTILWQMLMGMITLFILGLATALPVGLELLLQIFCNLSPSIPLALILSILELVTSLWVYLRILDGQGEQLLSRECRILDSVIQTGE